MSDQLAGDIVKSLAELLKKRRAGRDAMVAAQLKRNNAAELAQNKATKYWSPEAQAMVWGTAQEAAGMPTEQPWGEQRVDTVLPGASGVGEATWSMKNEDLPTTGYQTGKTTVDPTQVFQEYVDEFGNTRDLPYADKLKIYNEGGQLGDKGLLVAPPKKDVKTDPISGQQFYSNEYTGRGGTVTPGPAEIEKMLLSNNQPITDKNEQDILDKYYKSTIGKQKEAEIDYGAGTPLEDEDGNSFQAFQKGNQYVRSDGSIVENPKKYYKQSERTDSRKRGTFIKDGVPEELFYDNQGLTYKEINGKMQQVTGYQPYKAPPAGPKQDKNPGLFSEMFKDQPHKISQWGQIYDDVEKRMRSKYNMVDSSGATWNVFNPLKTDTGNRTGTAKKLVLLGWFSESEMDTLIQETPSQQKNAIIGKMKLLGFNEYELKVYEEGNKIRKNMVNPDVVEPVVEPKKKKKKAWSYSI